MSESTVEQYLEEQRREAVHREIDRVRAELAELNHLRAFLHSREMHPDYEYDTTEHARKSGDTSPEHEELWEANIHRGREGWERFDWHEERYWMRRKGDVD